MRSHGVKARARRLGQAGRRRSATTAASVVLTALSSILVSLGLSIATTAAASAASTWSSPTSIAAPTPPLSGSLDAVSCVDPTDWWVRTTLNSPSTSPNLAGCGAHRHRSHGRRAADPFQRSAVPPRATAQRWVRENDPAFTTEAIHATETNGTWGPDTEILDGTPITGSGEFTDLSGVSCADPLDCTAVGDTGDKGGNVPVCGNETNGTWSAIETFSTIAGEGDLTAVSCTDAENCRGAGNLSIGNTVPGWVTKIDGAGGEPPRRSRGTPSGFGSFSRTELLQRIQLHRSRKRQRSGAPAGHRDGGCLGHCY